MRRSECLEHIPTRASHGAAPPHPSGCRTPPAAACRGPAPARAARHCSRAPAASGRTYRGLRSEAAHDITAEAARRVPMGRARTACVPIGGRLQSPQQLAVCVCARADVEFSSADGVGWRSTLVIRMATHRARGGYAPSTRWLRTEHADVGFEDGDVPVQVKASVGKHPPSALWHSTL
jgi:hypothetical protein